VVFTGWPRGGYWSAPSTFAGVAQAAHATGVVAPAGRLSGACRRRQGRGASVVMEVAGALRAHRFAAPLFVDGGGCAAIVGPDGPLTPVRAMEGRHGLGVCAYTRFKTPDKAATTSVAKTDPAAVTGRRMPQQAVGALALTWLVYFAVGLRSGELLGIEPSRPVESPEFAQATVCEPDRGSE